MTVNTSSISALASSLAGAVLIPGDDGYEAASSVAKAPGAPAAVVLPATAGDVSAAVRFAASEQMALSVRSGGHSASAHGTNTGGLVINLSSLNAVTVEANGLVTIGGGAVWGAVATELARHGLAISSGDTVSVGVGGLTLGGGIGWLVRKHGLALDHLTAAEVVTASGDIVRADANTHADLFWAIRGGGGNFGVVTSFTFQANRIGTVVGGSISFGMQALEATIIAWRDAMRSAPEELTTTLIAMPDFGPFPAGVQIHFCYADDDEQAAAAALEQLLRLPGVISHELTPTDYADLLDEAHPPDGPMVVVDNNAFASELTDRAVSELTAYFTGLESSILMLRSLGGAFSRVAPDATAFAHRDSEALVMSVTFLPESSDTSAESEIHDRWNQVARHLSGTYSNFRSASDETVLRQMYPAATLERLTRVKTQYDPHNLFSRNLNIRPASR